MKKSLYIIILTVTFFSCNKGKNIADKDYILSTWKLSAVLADPGDGSGTFQPVVSNKNLIFWSNGVVTSSGALCDMSIESNTSSSGIYSPTNSTITPSDCASRTLWYESNGDTLIVSYPCIEPCRAKYIKVQ